MPSNPMMIAAALACVAMTSLAPAQTRVDCVRVRLVARVPHGLLAGPERPVAKTVPHLRQEPADRVARDGEPLEQAYRVAEARRVP